VPARGRYRSPEKRGKDGITTSKIGGGKKFRSQTLEEGTRERVIKSTQLKEIENPGDQTEDRWE